MLKLLIFVPCERLIIAEKGQPSLIGVIELVTVKRVPELTADALTPFRWSFITLWHREHDVAEPVTYQEELRLMRPDGSEALKIMAEFEVTNNHQNYRQDGGEIPVFPVGQEGVHLLELFLKKRDDPEWKHVTSFPIFVKHIPVEAQ